MKVAGGVGAAGNQQGFEHVWETGATRRVWIRGTIEVGKWYSMRVATRYLSVVMRTLFAMGTPRSLQSEFQRLMATLVGFVHALGCAVRHLRQQRRGGATVATQFRWTVPAAA